MKPAWDRLGQVREAGLVRAPLRSTSASRLSKFDARVH